VSCTSKSLSGAVVLLTFLCRAPACWAQAGDAAPTSTRRTLLEHIHAGGAIGYFIILMSIAGMALIVDAFLRLKEEKLVPAPMVEQARQLAQRGRFSELLALCKSHDSLLAHIVAAAMSQGSWGIEAVREAMQQQGEREMTQLRQRVGYIALLAAIAPMIGLLGTVVGLIQSFQVLGESKGAARPDELAVGISMAMVTTELGLIVAVPLICFHAVLRDRVTRIGQRAAAECERLVRIMAVVVETRQRERPAEPQVSVRS
jgi:biopolymer transport protein ExbB